MNTFFEFSRFLLNTENGSAFTFSRHVWAAPILLLIWMVPKFSEALSRRSHFTEMVVILAVASSFSFVSKQVVSANLPRQPKVLSTHVLNSFLSMVLRASLPTTLLIYIQPTNKPIFFGEMGMGSTSNSQQLVCHSTESSWRRMSPKFVYGTALLSTRAVPVFSRRVTLEKDFWSTRSCIKRALTLKASVS
jgi:hypothetical protein